MPTPRELNFLTPILLVMQLIGLSILEPAPIQVTIGKMWVMGSELAVAMAAVIVITDQLFSWLDH